MLQPTDRSPADSLVHTLLDCSLAGLSPVGRSVVQAIAFSQGAFVSSTVLAARVGLKDRHALDRLLNNQGLPTYKELAGWIRVLGWVLDWERAGVALSNSSLSTGRNAGVYARTVQRVTGLTWTEVRSRGSDWALLELVSRCRLARAKAPGGPSSDADLPTRLRA